MVCSLVKWWLLRAEIDHSAGSLTTNHLLHYGSWTRGHYCLIQFDDRLPLSFTDSLKPNKERIDVDIFVCSSTFVLITAVNVALPIQISLIPFWRTIDKLFIKVIKSLRLQHGIILTAVSPSRWREAVLGGVPVVLHRRYPHWRADAGAVLLHRQAEDRVSPSFLLDIVQLGLPSAAPPALLLPGSETSTLHFSEDYVNIP